MRQQISWNWLAMILTMGTILIMVIAMMATRDEPTKYYVVGSLLLCTLVVLWLFSPRFLETDGDSVIIHTRLKKKRIPFSEIREVSYYTPHAFTGIKLCGSGGFGGFWGWYSAPDIGTYFAYYGNPKNCFLVELKNGRKYVLGCDNPDLIMDEIRKSIK